MRPKCAIKLYNSEQVNSDKHTIFFSLYEPVIVVVYF